MKNRNLYAILLVVVCFVPNIAKAQDPILNSIIKIVSPLEVSVLIKNMGINYNSQLLNSPTNAYQSDFKRALNLGVYTTDLGYANINEQQQATLAYMGSIKNLANDLQVGQFINTGKIITLATNKQNMNLLLEETSTTFESMSNYLQSQDRSVLAALMLTGGWMETLYITCEVAKKFPENKELTDRIVQQQIILDQILTVLQPYQASDNNLRLLAADLQGLQGLLKRYNLTQESGEVSTTQETIGGVEVIVVESAQVAPDIIVSEQDLYQISAKVADIRNKIVQ